MVGLIIVALFLVGCTAHYPVVGSFEDFNEVVYGSVDHNLANGTAFIQVEGKNSKMRCTGNSRVTYIPPISYVIPTCAGQRGVADLSCNDGRKIQANWSAKSCTTGVGSGYDQKGNKFTFVFGMEEEKALEFVKVETAKSKEKPDLPPVYKPKEVRKEKGYSIGTGFFINNHGYIVTNHHVVEDSNAISIVLADGTEHEAELINSDSANDIALLKTNISGTSLAIGTATDKQKGEEVLTLGYPLVQLQGQEQKATFGRINAKSGIKGDIRFLQIDVPIQPGNSGGPLIDNKGSVVGVVTATLNQLVALRESGALPQSVNYAVKSDYVIPLLRSEKVNWREQERLEEMKMPNIVTNSEKSVVMVIAK